ncbi:fibrinogen-like 2a [Astyanax mexicanus]|uniref:fibrinogen-like 2a n=1 Tax=Astyanax mexicanus TaxID=7994 RepID=UPI0020CAFD64|nr:fibrinogen-like 2a [Astyanax mexicanus]
MLRIMRPILAWMSALLVAVPLGLEAAVSGATGVLGKSSELESCSQVKLRPAGQCGDEEECPYQITLPPMTIQLPKQFRLLEKTMKELQSLKETVRQLRSACLECGQQADESIRRDTSETPTKKDHGRGDSSRSAPSNSSSSNDVIQEMQTKMSRMSNSLKNARNQINTMQVKLDMMNGLSQNVEEVVDRRVANLTGVINKLSSTCSTECAAARSAPQYMIAHRDCSDYSDLKHRINGVYSVTPDLRNDTFEVFCDMESYGGGWTVVQRRVNGAVSFNRTWAEYKKGFGDLQGDFWLGNDKIHLLTKTKDMVLRIELEDFLGVREYAKYDQFYVSNEFLNYRLSLNGYSGTAGDAMHPKHDQKFFTTHDKDNDMYPSGNCGTYYGSGWWFNTCMSANLNGKYYIKRYKGKRDGIFWSTWHNITSEYYPTNYRRAFKTVTMMIRPKTYAP